MAQHRAKWTGALLGELPDPASYAQFRRDFEAGVASRSEFQKNLRKERLGTAVAKIVYDTSSGMHHGSPLNLEDPDVYWRAECLLAWSEALNRESQSSRDYADWLAPHLKKDSFKSADYPTFWLIDVQASEVPKNRLSSLISFFQLDSKITHGNAEDSQHACHALDVDVFVTEDAGFYHALTMAAKHFERFSRIYFIERAAPSLLPHIELALGHRPSL